MRDKSVVSVSYIRGYVSLWRGAMHSFVHRRQSFQQRPLASIVVSSYWRSTVLLADPRYNSGSKGRQGASQFGAALLVPFELQPSS